MPLVCIVDLDKGAFPGWWSWHLAWMLAQQGVGPVVWTEVGTTRWTQRLMPPSTWEVYETDRHRPAWIENGALNAAMPEPDRQGLSWLPGAEGTWGEPLDVSSIQTALIAAMEAEPETWWVVDLATPSVNHWDKLLDVAGTTVLVLPVMTLAAKSLAARQDELRSVKNPRYCLVRTSGRESTEERRYLEGLVRERFHRILRQVPGPAVTESLADFWCVGRVSDPWNPYATQAGRIPVFRLPYWATGHGVAEGQIRSARQDWDEVAKRLESGLLGQVGHPTAIDQPPTPDGPVPRHLIAWTHAQTYPSLIGSDGFLLGLKADEWNPATRRILPARQCMVEWCAGNEPEWLFVLAGEAGLGKSTLLQDLSGTAGLPEPIALGAENLELTRLTRTSSPCLVLDGLDEWPGNPRDLVDELKAWRQRAGTGAKVVVAGRPGRTMQHLTAAFAGFVQQWLLLPLRRMDAEVLALHQGVSDPDNLMQEVDRLGLGALAGTPQTLVALVGRWRRDRVLPGTRWEALELLVRQAAILKEVPVERVVPAASLLAWVSLLCRAPVITKARATKPHMLSSAELAALGAQVWPAASLTGQAVQTEAVDAALRSGLFVRVSEGNAEARPCWQFAHHRYAEMLAASYAKQLLTALGRVRWRLLRRWFLTPDGEAVHEHLAGVLGLLASQHLEVAEELIAGDPVGLLQLGADVPPAARRPWLQALAVELARPNRWIQQARYVSLVAEDTVTDAAALLAQPEVAVVNLGIEVLSAHVKTGVGRDEALQGLARAVREAPTPGPRGLALVRLSECHADLLGLGLAGPDWRDIHKLALEDDSYRWCVLTALWPKFIGASEALQLLGSQPRKEAAFLDAFAEQHGAQIVASVSPDNLAETMTRYASGRWRHQFMELNLIRRAWDALDLGPELAVPLSLLLRPHLADLKEVDVDWGLPDDPRRLLVLEALLRLLSETQVNEHWRSIFDAALYPAPEKIVERALAHRTEDVALARKWGLLCQVLNPFNPMVVALIEPLFDLLPELQGWCEEASVERQRRSSQVVEATRAVRPARERRAAFLTRLLDLAETSPNSWRPFFKWLFNGGARSVEILTESDQARLGELAADYLLMSRFEWQEVVSQGSFAVGEFALAWGWPDNQRTPSANDLVERLGPAVFHIRGLHTGTPGIGRFIPDGWGVGLRDLGDLAKAVGRLPDATFETWLLEALTWPTSISSHPTIARWATMRWQAHFGAAFEKVLEDGSAPESVRGEALTILLRSDPARSQFGAWCKPNALSAWVLGAMLSAGLAGEAIDAFLALAPGNEPSARQASAAFATLGRAGWNANVAPERLVAYCRWLHAQFGVAAPKPGVLFGPDNFRFVDLRHLRSALAEAGDVEATRNLDDLPNNAGFLAHAIRRRRALDWKPPSLQSLVALSPKLETPADLRAVVIAALEAVQKEDLQGPVSVNQFFFHDDTERSRIREVRACYLLGNLLGHQLRAIGVSVDPKFEVQQHEAKDRVDLQLAISIPRTGDFREILCHIEVKWMDHGEAKGKALAEQAGRYQGRDEVNSTAIFLVLWYANATSGNASWRRSIETVRKDLELEADTLTATNGVRPVEPFVLEIKRPEPKPTKDEPAKDEPAKDEPAKDEPTKDEPTKAKLAKARPAKAKPAKAKPAKAKPAKAPPPDAS